MPTLSSHVRLLTFVYVCTRFVLPVQCAHSGIRKWGFLRSKSTPSSSNRNADPQNSPPHERSPKRSYSDPSSTEVALSVVYDRLWRAHDTFSKVYGPSGKNDLRFEAVNIGLDAVSLFLPRRSLCTPHDSKKVRCTGHCAMFPCGLPLQLKSAITGKTGWYKTIRCGPWPLLRGPDNHEDNFQYFYLDEQSLKRQVSPARYAKRMEEILSYLDIFNVDALRDVEHRYYVLVPRDILTRPYRGSYSRLPERGATINLYPIYRPTACRLLHLINMIPQVSDLPAEFTAMGNVARLNLSLQLLQLFGRLAHAGVVLERLYLADLVVDETGRVFVGTHATPRKEVRETSATPPTSDSGSSARRGTSLDALPTGSGSGVESPKSSLRSNARAAVVLLLYLWCPDAVKSISTIDATREEVLTSWNQSQSCSMPSELRNIIHRVVEENASLADILFTTSFIRLHSRLQRMLEEDATGLETRL